ncbi:MAG: hypothetical protein DMF89_21090 [Acidobacteria bacterium]|nr:MAG: hypothetical protein DMF89_21090 [Acidobacteriota bacterium]
MSSDALRLTMRRPPGFEIPRTGSATIAVFLLAGPWDDLAGPGAGRGRGHREIQHDEILRLIAEVTRDLT